MDLDWIFTGAIILVVLYLLTGYEWVYHVALFVGMLTLIIIFVEICFNNKSLGDKLEDPTPSADEREHGPIWASF